MQIDMLREFLDLARALNFRAVSKKRHMSQSALSMHIVSLEKELEVELFDRASTPVTLTRAGMELANKAQSLVDDHDSIVEYCKMFSKRKEIVIKRPHCRCDVDTVLGVVGRLHAVSSDVSVIMESFEKRNVFEGFMSGEIDGFVSTALGDRLPEDICGHLHAITLRCSPLMVRIRESSHLANKEQISMLDLESSTFAVPGGEGLVALRAAMEHVFESNGVNPPKRYLAIDSVEDLRIAMLEGNYACLIVDEKVNLKDHVVRQVNCDSPPATILYLRNEKKRTELTAFERAAKQYLSDR